MGLSSRQIDSIFEYLQGASIQVRTMVVERDYVDADYLDDFASFYAYCFPPYARHCKRLHFFRESFTADEIDAILAGNSEEALSKLKHSYAGFIVARPLPEAIIGRTVLRRKRRSDDGVQFYPITRRYTPNFFGIKLSVRGLAFEEQDTTVAACATVALWSAFHKTQQLYSTPLPRPAAITRAANVVRSHWRAFPSSHGLDPVQMSEAIRAVGLEAEHFRVGPKVPFASLVYAYLAAEIPVVLSGYVERTKGLGFHAVTVTGYSWSKGAIQFPEKATNLVRSRPGQHIDRLFVHDDNVGPFTELLIRPLSELNDPDRPRDVEPPVILQSTAKPGPGYDAPAAFVPTAITVPTLSEMRVTWKDIHPWLLRLQVFLWYFRKFFRQHGIHVGKLQWDIRISRGNAFKRFLRKEHISNSDARQVITESLPRYLWRATMYNDEDAVLELIADATDTARSCPLLRTIWYDVQVKQVFEDVLSLSEVDKKFRLMLRPRFFELLKNGRVDHLIERRAPSR